MPQCLRNPVAITPCTDFLFIFIFSEPFFLSKILLVSCFWIAWIRKGPLRDVGSSNPNDVCTTNSLAVGSEFRIQRSSIPHAPFFRGFPPVGSQMPFVFPHYFMPLVPRVGFAPPTQGGPSATIDLTAGSQKRGSHECVTDQSKSSKKRRGPRKKLEMTWRTKWSSWRLVGIGRIIGSSSWLPFGERSTVISLHHRSKVMFGFFPPLFFQARLDISNLARAILLSWSSTLHSQGSISPRQVLRMSKMWSFSRYVNASFSSLLYVVRFPHNDGTSPVLYYLSFSVTITLCRRRECLTVPFKVLSYEFPHCSEVQRVFVSATLEYNHFLQHLAILFEF